MKSLSFSISLVAYCNSSLDINFFCDSINKINRKFTLFIVDHSPNSILNLFSITNKNCQFIYFHNPLNPGFGSGHNFAIKKAIDLDLNYNFVVNPDVYFDELVINELLNYISENENIGMIMPQILNFDGSIQYLPKLLPTPFWIFVRKFKFPYFYYKKFISRFEMRNIPSNLIYNVPLISGCFSLLNLAAVKKVGLYDERFFMYFEDWDLSRRMYVDYKTVVFPFVSVYHGYKSGANHNFKLFFIFIKSAFLYFNKWGWFFDKERTQMNKKTLSQFK